MDAQPPPSEPPPGEPAAGESSLSPLKAAAILVVFVVATIVLVAYGTRAVTAPSGTPSSAATTSTTTVPGSTTTTAPGQTTTSTTAHTGTTTAHHGHRTGATTTTTTVPHSAVSVVVANATTVNGVAAHYSTVIGAGGWNMKAPTDADTNEATSAVYYAPGQQEAAASIATAIGVKPAQVLPISSATPLSPTTGLDVIVIVGQDLATAPGA
jgi:LytR cell envelope-related transcriptional attenuator